MKARLLAEAMGSLVIVTAVLGAGFMVSSLGAEPALGLLMIASAVAAVLFVLISTLGPVSGGHFNPIVTLALWFRKDFPTSEVIPYLFVQLLGAVLGAVVANLMFDQQANISDVTRFSFGAMVGETIASAGLVFLILQLIDRKKEALIAPAVALWILAGHIFTSSTSFANPAVTIGRVFSSAPSSISPESALYFLLAQFVGLFLALVISTQLRKVSK